MSNRAFSDKWNFWVVKYLRQIRHNYALAIAVGVLLIVQFLIFRSYLGEREILRMWPPWWLVMLLIGCGVGTSICVALGFAGAAASGDGPRPGLAHFSGFAPMDVKALFRGYLFSHLLTFGILFLSCLFAWIAVIFFFPEKILIILAWMFDAYFVSLFLLQIDGTRWVRADLMLLVAMVPLFLMGERDAVPPGTLLIFLFIVAAYQLLNFYEALKSPVEVKEVWLRVSQLGLLIAGVVFCLPPFRLREPVLIAAAAAGALASMGSAMNGIPERQLDALSGGFLKRFFAWLLYGSSAGGWIWCWVSAGAAWRLLYLYDVSNFWWLLVSWGLASAEAGFLIVTALSKRSRRGVSALAYYASIPIGCFIVGMGVALISITAGIAGEEIFRTVANCGWGAAVLLLIPNVPRLYGDFRKIVSGRRM